MGKSDVQETLVALYLRLSGYFVSGFIVHDARGAGTEMDALAVRFPLYKEPEREVRLCRHLAIPSDCVDFIVGEVKGGQKAINFNHRFRDDPACIRTVLRRFGAFQDGEINRVTQEVPSLLDPSRLMNSASFPELDLTLAKEIGNQKAKLRFVLFAVDQQRPQQFARPYIFGDDLVSYVWTCLRQKPKRPLSAERYNFELWGPQFQRVVQYFKSRQLTDCPTMEQLVDALTDQ